MIQPPPEANLPDRGRQITYYMAAALVSCLAGASLAYFPAIQVAGVLVAAGGMIAIIWRPYIGLLLYMVVFILRPGELFPVLAALRLERILGAFTLAAMFNDVLRRKGALMIDSSSQTRWYLAFIVAIGLSIPFSHLRGQSVTTLTDMFKILALYLMIVHLIDTRRKMYVFVWLYMGLVVYLGVESLRLYFSGGAVFVQGIERATGTSSAAGNYNKLGATLASTMVLFFLMFVAESSIWRRILLAGGLATSLWAMVLTGSRASMLGFLAGVSYLWWSSGNRALWGMVGILVLVGGYFLMPGQYQGRYRLMSQEELDGSSQARLESWKTGVKMFADHPVFGVGAGAFGTARAAEYSFGRRPSWLNSHSVPVQVMSELGVIGIVTFFGLLASFLRLNRKTARLIRSLGPDRRMENAIVAGLFAGFLVLMVSGLFGNSLFRRTWYVFAALGLALYRIHFYGEGGEEEGEDGGAIGRNPSPGSPSG